MPAKSYINCRFAAYSNQLTSKETLGMSPKILRIMINEIISNCFETAVVNDLGRYTIKR